MPGTVLAPGDIVTGLLSNAGGISGMVTGDDVGPAIELIVVNQDSAGRFEISRLGDSVSRFGIRREDVNGYSRLAIPVTLVPRESALPATWPALPSTAGSAVPDRIVVVGSLRKGTTPTAHLYYLTDGPALTKLGRLVDPEGFHTGEISAPLPADEGKMPNWAIVVHDGSFRFTSTWATVEARHWAEVNILAADITTLGDVYSGRAPPAEAGDPR